MGQPMGRLNNGTGQVETGSSTTRPPNLSIDSLNLKPLMIRAESSHKVRKGAMAFRTTYSLMARKKAQWLRRPGATSRAPVLSPFLHALHE